MTASAGPRKNTETGAGHSSRPETPADQKDKKHKCKPQGKHTGKLGTPGGVARRRDSGGDPWRQWSAAGSEEKERHTVG